MIKCTFINKNEDMIEECVKMISEEEAEEILTGESSNYFIKRA